MSLRARGSRLGPAGVLGPAAGFDRERTAGCARSDAVRRRSRPTRSPPVRARHRPPAPVRASPFVDPFRFGGTKDQIVQQVDLASARTAPRRRGSHLDAGPGDALLGQAQMHLRRTCSRCRCHADAARRTELLDHLRRAGGHRPADEPGARDAQRRRKGVERVQVQSGVSRRRTTRARGSQPPGALAEGSATTRRRTCEREEPYCWTRRSYRRTRKGGMNTIVFRRDMLDLQRAGRMRPARVRVRIPGRMRPRGTCVEEAGRMRPEEFTDPDRPRAHAPWRRTSWQRAGCARGRGGRPGRRAVRAGRAGHAIARTIQVARLAERPALFVLNRAPVNNPLVRRAADAIATTRSTSAQSSCASAYTARPRLHGRNDRDRVGA